MKYLSVLTLILSAISGPCFSAILDVAIPSQGSVNYNSSNRPPANGSWVLWCKSAGGLDAHEVRVSVQGIPESEAICWSDGFNGGKVISGTFPASGIIQAKSATAPGGSLTVQLRNPNGNFYTMPYMLNLTIAKTCGASVDSVTLGDLLPGQNTTASMNITKTGNGTGVVTITGKDLLTDGIVHVGGSSKGITVYPTDKNTYTDGAKWISNGAKNTIPLTVNVSSSAGPGAAQSSLTATLTCS